MRELNGDDGPLRDVVVTRDDGTFSTSYSATGTLDLAGAADRAHRRPRRRRRRCSSQQVDVNAVDQALLADLRDAFGLR